MKILKVSSTVIFDSKSSSKPTFENCGVAECVAEYVAGCVAVSWSCSVRGRAMVSVVQCVAVCCVAVCCSALQCVAVCCGVLQCTLRGRAMVCIPS